MEKRTAFETTNRKLEQFLHIHKIEFYHQYKNSDFMTVWMYQRTPRLEQVVAEFREIMAFTPAA